MTREVNVSIREINTKARIIGILFLAATLAFMSGSKLIEAFFLNINNNMVPLIAGVVLQVLDGVAVAFIGILAFSILKGIDKKLSLSYAVLRIIEFGIIMGAGAYLLFRQEKLPGFDFFLCICTGGGGLIFSYLLLKSRLVPRVLSILGMIGYAVLCLGVVLDLFGLIKIYEGLGSIFLAPGGLFELFLPIWLLIKGLKSTPTAGKTVQVA